MRTPPFQKILRRILSEQPPTFLDPSFYTSAELLPLEQQHIFQKSWIYVGHAAKLAEPNSGMITEVADRSLLLTRTKEGTLKAFYNVCPHRGALLETTEVAKPLKCLVCPYHGWVFDSSGQLKATPEKTRFSQAIDFKKFSLKPVRLETWGPLMFVCLSESAPPLSAFLGEAYTRMAAFPMEQVVCLFEKDYTVRCNWKTFHDNSLCDYHVSIAHPNTLKDVQGLTKYYQYALDDYVNVLETPITKAWLKDHQVLDELSEPLRSQFLTFGIFPNLHVYALPNGHLFIERIEPVSVDTCQVHTEVYGIPGHDDADSLAALETWYDELFDEDLTLTEGVQKGYASGAFSPGPINELEARIVHQQQLIRRFLLQGLKSQTPMAGGSHSAVLENAAGFEFLVRKYSQSQALREKALIP